MLAILMILNTQQITYTYLNFLEILQRTISPGLPSIPSLPNAPGTPLGP